MINSDMAFNRSTQAVFGVVMGITESFPVLVGDGGHQWILFNNLWVQPALSLFTTQNKKKPKLTTVLVSSNWDLSSCLTQNTVRNVLSFRTYTSAYKLSWDPACWPVSNIANMLSSYFSFITETYFFLLYFLFLNPGIISFWRIRRKKIQPIFLLTPGGRWRSIYAS